MFLFFLLQMIYAKKLIFSDCLGQMYKTEKRPQSVNLVAFICDSYFDAKMWPVLPNLYSRLD